MAHSTRNGEPHDGEIRLWREDDRWFARDIETDLTTRGRSREAALAALVEAIARYQDESGEPPTAGEFRSMGIDIVGDTAGHAERPDAVK